MFRYDSPHDNFLPCLSLTVKQLITEVKLLVKYNDLTVRYTIFEPVDTIINYLSWSRWWQWTRCLGWAWEAQYQPILWQWRMLTSGSIHWHSHGWDWKEGGYHRINSSVKLFSWSTQTILSYHLQRDTTGVCIHTVQHCNRSSARSDVNTLGKLLWNLTHMKRALCLTNRSMADNDPKAWFVAMKKNTPILQDRNYVCWYTTVL